MIEQITKLAQMVGAVPEEEVQVLRMFCELADLELRGRLKPSIMAEDCASAFQMAAAWIALAGYCAGSGGGVLKVGELTLEENMNAGEQIKLLRQQAERVMAPYLRDEGFSFQGVRG